MENECCRLSWIFSRYGILMLQHTIPLTAISPERGQPQEPSCQLGDRTAATGDVQQIGSSFSSKPVSSSSRAVSAHEPIDTRCARLNSKDCATSLSTRDAMRKAQWQGLHNKLINKRRNAQIWQQNCPSSIIVYFTCT